MSRALKRIFVHGFPSLYGGAGTELHHQMIVWRKMGMEVHLIPTGDSFYPEGLYVELLRLGVVIHAADDWTALEPGDPVMGFLRPHQE